MNYKLSGLAMVLLACVAWAQQPGDSPHSHGDAAQAKDGTHQHCPMMSESRADEGMGFSQSKTTHHFYLKKDGGVIEVSANDPKDTESRDQIRMHLAHVAKEFAAGNFDIPMFVHDQVPPGVPVMQGRKDKLTYKFEETDRGGRVVISTADHESLSAVHDFLAFQIREHKTGDDAAVH